MIARKTTKELLAESLKELAKFKSVDKIIWRKDRLLTPQAQILLDEMKNRLE